MKKHRHNASVRKHVSHIFQMKAFDREPVDHDRTELVRVTLEKVFRWPTGGGCCLAGASASVGGNHRAFLQMRHMALL